MPKAPAIVQVKRTDPRRGRRYTANWPKIRHLFLQAHPFCDACGNWATQVHHKNGIRTNNDPSNLQALCSPCHHGVEALKTK